MLDEIIKEYNIQLKEQLAKQDEIIKNLKSDVMLLKQDMDKYVTKSNSLDEDIKNLQERLDYLEGRHIWKIIVLLTVFVNKLCNHSSVY